MQHMDQSEGYFHRTNWFAWLGLITCIFTWTLMAWSMTDTWIDKSNQLDWIYSPSFGGVSIFTITLSVILRKKAKAYLKDTTAKARAIATVYLCGQWSLYTLLGFYGLIVGWNMHNFALILVTNTFAFLLQLIAIPLGLLGKHGA